MNAIHQAALAVGVALMGAPTAALAAPAEAPLFAPAPGWVKPAQVDTTPPKNAAGAAVAALLLDVQVKLSAQTQTTYTEIVETAQTPQGLQPVGNVTLQWQPATDRLIIHKLQVLRAGKVIDVLTTGPGFTTLRRESRLEEAALDGTLTATTQIEGLQVGDTLDMAYSIERSAPIMKGKVQEDFALNLAPIARERLRVLWPTNLDIRSKVSDLAPALNIKTENGVSEALLASDDVQSVELPKLAPQRFLRGREIQLTNFGSWADVSALLAPEFAEASSLAAGSPLRAEISKIAAQISDSKARAEAALELVQNSVRYVFVGLNGGGLKPASADLTWSRRFGDCKGKTALLLALLHGLGIEAEPALVSTVAGDGLDAQSPMLGFFDHVLVRATIGGKTYWLDGARIGDRSLDSIVTPAFFWALPIQPSGGALARLEPEPLAAPANMTSLRLDASNGITLPAPAHVEAVLRGDEATTVSMQLANLAPADLERALRAYWQSQYDFITIKSATATFDRASGEERLVMDGSAQMDWSGTGYSVDGSTLGWKPDLTRDPGPHADAPFAVVFPAFNREVEIIVLPNKGAGFSIVGQDIKETVGGMEFYRHAAIDKGVFTMEASSKAVAREFPASQAPVVAKRLAEIAKMGLYVARPATFQHTAAEVDALVKSQPATVEQYIIQGGAFTESRRFDEAVGAFDKALELDPKSATALADRGWAWFDKDDIAKAAVDTGAALKIDPQNTAGLRLRGAIAEKSSRWNDAVADFTVALRLVPADAFSLSHRAYDYLRLREPKLALADIEAGLKLRPDETGFLVLKAEAYLDQNDVEGATAATKTLLASKPDDPAIQKAATQFQARAVRIKEALAGWKQDQEAAVKKARQ